LHQDKKNQKRKDDNSSLGPPLKYFASHKNLIATMESRKRKEMPEGVTEDELDRRTKSREIREEEVAVHAAASIEDPALTTGDMLTETTAAAASTVDASVLPSSTESIPTPTEPAIVAEKLLMAPTMDTAVPEMEMENQDLTATIKEDAVLKPPPKPYTAEELSHWNQMFFELMLYRIAHGNVNVKSTDRKHEELYKWIVQLRKDYKTRERDPSDSPLTEDQIKVLESVRFAFTTRGEEHWQKSYEKLKEYKRDHGHVLVPRQCEIPGLGDWVTSQRQQYQEYRKGRPTPLTKQRKELLDAIGFQFRIRNRPEWSSKYDELLQYKEKHGDTRVPQHFKENKALGKWVAKQREQYKLHKKGKHSFLTPDRLEKLNSIGFVWSVRGETSASPSDKNAPSPLPEEEAESATISVVDAAFQKSEEEEKAMKVEKEGEVNAEVPIVGEVSDTIDV